MKITDLYLRRLLSLDLRGDVVYIIGMREVVLDEEFEYLRPRIKFNYNYPVIYEKDNRTFLHHLVIGKPPAGLEVDHINRNTFDNRKQNLRFLSHGDNMRNRLSWSKSGYRGAYLDKSSKRSKPWRSEIKLKGKRINLGYYDTAVKAHEAYLSKCKELNLLLPV